MTATHKNKSISHPRADYYVTFPFHINNWKDFDKDLHASGIWEAKTDCTRESLRNVVNSYLGEDKPVEFPIQSGLAYTGYIQRSSNKSLSSFAGEVAFRDAKGKMICMEKRDPETGEQMVRTFWPEFEIDLHVAPNRHCGVAVMRLSTGDCSLKEAVEINYTIQKCDERQTPAICSFRDGEWHVIEGRSSLSEIFLDVLPKALVPENEARFIMASCVMVDTSDGQDDLKLEDALMRLGMVKGWLYDLDKTDKKLCRKLFNNIWTYASHEGFAAIAMTPDLEKERYLKEFHGRFAKSYLSVFIANVLADLTYRSALRNLDAVADSLEEQDRIQETRIMLRFEPSPYSHLIQLMNSMAEVWRFEEKYEVIAASIRARIDNKEAERLQVEKRNQELAIQKKAEDDAARRALEDEKTREREARERHDRNVNLLLGFIGLGQVLFAILQLLGAEEVMGEAVAKSPELTIVSVIFSVGFFVMIIWAVLKALHRKTDSRK